MNPYMGGDFSLTSNAVYLPKLIRISTLAGIFEKSSHSYGPYSVSSIPSLNDAKAVSIAVSESVFDNVIWVYFRANKVRLENQPSDIGYNFTIYANIPPSVTINETGVYNNFNGTLDGYFANNGTLAFSVLFYAIFNINISITEQGNIIVQIPALSIENMNLTYSFFVRRIPEKAFLNWLKNVITTRFPKIIDKLNTYLKENAIDLPSLPGINWNNSNLQLQNSWIIFASDLTG